MTAIGHEQQAIPRLPNGTVDLESSEALTIIEALRTIETTDEEQRVEAAGELLRYLLELKWWELFCQVAWPSWVPSDFAWFHRDMWSWFMGLEPGETVDALIACLFREASKSTTFQLALAVTALRGVRNFAIYVEATQATAERKVQGVANLIQTPVVKAAFPEVATIYRDRLGKQRDWTKSRVRTASDFTLDGLGMDVAIRGVKVDEYRPDLIILDDLEDSTDTEYMTGRKEETVTDVIINAGSVDVAIAFAQNRIHDESMMAKLTDGRAEYLTQRKIIGPVPAIHGFEYETVKLGDDKFYHKITNGTPAWPERWSLPALEADLNKIGPSSFLKEKQHEGRKGDGLWSEKVIELMRRPASWPDAQGGGLAKVVVGVDPSVGTGTGDECGIVVCGLAEDGNAYILEDASIQAHPSEWVAAVTSAYTRWKAIAIVAEINHGHQLVLETIRRYSPNLPIVAVRAIQGKALRAQPFSILSEQGRIRFAGDHPQLRHQMLTWNPDKSSKSPDRLDAMVYSLVYLLPVDGGQGLFSVVRKGR